MLWVVLEFDDIVFVPAVGAAAAHQMRLCSTTHSPDMFDRQWHRADVTRTGRSRVDASEVRLQFGFISALRLSSWHVGQAHSAALFAHRTGDRRRDDQVVGSARKSCHFAILAVGKTSALLE